jgi:uncharacterized protein (UPF0276 family)
MSTGSPPATSTTFAPTKPAGLLDGVGVGIMFNAALPDYLLTAIDTIDYLEIIPDTFWTDRGPASRPRFVEVAPYVEVLDQVAASIPIVAHHLGLSVGTAEPADPEYVSQLARWQERYGFPWHSDHLAVARVPGSDRREHAGVAIPVPFDEDMLTVMATRVGEVHAAIPIPFLVENSVYFLDIIDQDYGEAQFLNELSHRSGCGLLLDLHNLYANARNHELDAYDFLAELDLERVLEIHIAGGSEFAGMWTDSHSGPCQEGVWELLDWVLPKTPNLRGVTFEFHHSYFPVLGNDGIAVQLARARQLCERHRPAPTPRCR